MSKCILVIGVPRSGTSCVAGILHHLGIDMGEKLMPADNRWNPAGFFQDEELENILHNDIGLWKFPDWTTSKRKNPNLVKYFKKRNKSNLWGVKSNRLIYCLEEFLTAVSDVTIIRTQRDLSKSIQSWESLSGDGDGHEYNPIRRMYNAIEKGFQELGVKEDLIVNYDRLIEDPTETVASIAQICGVELNNDAINFINSNLRHF